MASIKDRLASIEDDFLDAVLIGGSSLSAFEERWDCLLADVNALFDTGSLDDETSSLAHSTALRIATLADTSADLFARRDAITSDFMTEIDGLMSHLTISDDIPSGEWTYTLKSCNTAALSPRSIPPSPPASRKRRRIVDSDDECDTAVKRPHLDSASRFVETVPVYLPTPCHDDALPLTPRLLAPSPKITRKRRLSDAGIVDPPRAAKRLYAGPRLHAVSDSFLAICPLRNPCAPSNFEGSNFDVKKSDVVAAQSHRTSPLSPSLQVCEAQGSVPPLPLSPQCRRGSLVSMSTELDDLDEFLKSLLDGDIPHISTNLPAQAPRPASESPFSSPASSLSSLPSLSVGSSDCSVRSSPSSPVRIGLPGTPSEDFVPCSPGPYSLEPLPMKSFIGLDLSSSHATSLYDPCDPCVDPATSFNSTASSVYEKASLHRPSQEVVDPVWQFDWDTGVDISSLLGPIPDPSPLLWSDMVSLPDFDEDGLHPAHQASAVGIDYVRGADTVG